MAISKESKEFFSKLSRIWQNFKDYTYLQGIELSPEQISIIEQEEDQLLIEGFAGTGKSLTLLYKFINILIREENQRILFVTFNNTLIDDTEKRLNTSKEYRENKQKHNIQIATFHEMATDLLKEIKVIDKGIGKLTVDKVNYYRGNTYRRIAAILDEYTNVSSNKYKILNKDERLYSTHNAGFVTDEISWMKSMGLVKLDKYLTTERTGRSKSIRLTRAQRKTIFSILEQYQKEMKDKYKSALDLEDYALKLIENSYMISEKLKYDYIFVDEVQDLDPMQVKALCMLTKKSIVLSGDAKQRIYKKSPLKYEDIGLKIREKGKRKILNKNFRSTAQIVKLANSLDFFDEEEKLMEKLFVKDGSKPIIHRSADNKNAVRYIINEIKKINSEDPFKTIAIVHREEVKAKYGHDKSKFRIDLEVGLFQNFTDIDDYGLKFEYNAKNQIFYTNAYDIKGLEFDVVFIIDFNSKFYPHQKEIQAIKEQNEAKDAELVNDDIIDFINREKKLLYVAMTRAKEKLYLIANNCDIAKQISSFIFDFSSDDYQHSNFIKREIEILKVHHKQWIKSMLIKKKSEKSDSDKIGENEISAKLETAANMESNFKMNDNKASSNIMKRIEQNQDKNEEKDNLIETIVKPFLIKNKLTIIDKRDKGGALWVLGGQEIAHIMKRLEVGGMKFKFVTNGGKSTKNKPAWYYNS